MLAYRVHGHDRDLGLTYTYFNSTDVFATTAGSAGLVYPTLSRAGPTNYFRGDEVPCRSPAGTLRR